MGDLNIITEADRYVFGKAATMKSTGNQVRI